MDTPALFKSSLTSETRKQLACLSVCVCVSLSVSLCLCVCVPAKPPLCNVIHLPLLAVFAFLPWGGGCGGGAGKCRGLSSSSWRSKRLQLHAWNRASPQATSPSSHGNTLTTARWVLSYTHRETERARQRRDVQHTSQVCARFFLWLCCFGCVFWHNTHTHTKDPAEQLECGDQIPEEVTEARIPRHCH